MKNTTVYERLVDGKLLLANVTYIDNHRVFYYFGNPKRIFKENAKLFLSVFTKKAED